jgi:plasmid maintenance system antidote protein VapI
VAPKRKTEPANSATVALRQAIAECGFSFVELERRTGVKRQSMMKFARGEQSLRLDMADRLLACLGLEVVTRRKAK